METKTFLQVIGEGEDAGFRPVSDAEISEASLGKFIDLIANQPRHSQAKREYLIRESMTTSDFPFLLGQVIDRQLVGRYQSYVPDWKAYVRTGRLRDFRPAYKIKTWGGGSILTEVKELGEYPAAALSEGKYSIQLKKWGRQIPISWEALVNDDLGAFNDIAAAPANAAIQSEWYYVTSLIAASAGPNTALYGATVADAADGGAITNKGALPLTIANLEATLKLMAAQVDKEGNPVLVQGVHLVVPPALEFTARQILTSSFIIGVGTANAAEYKGSSNVLPQLGIQLHINPWLPIIDTSNKKNATWYLFADPAVGPAVELDYLSGYETPQVAMKATDKSGVGSPMDGDFAHDRVVYRVRHIFGGCQLDPRYTYAQTGS